ncbi:hypothetical protein JOE25_003036 [Serratia sp. PL17]|nr:hypothetical protein [Serratia sp. PL17]
MSGFFTFIIRYRVMNPARGRHGDYVSLGIRSVLFYFYDGKIRTVLMDAFLTGFMRILAEAEEQYLAGYRTKKRPHAR